MGARTIPRAVTAAAALVVAAGTFTFNSLAGQLLNRRLDYVCALKPLDGPQDPLCLPDRSDHCWTHGHPTFQI